jgi:hypothetical protein
MAHDDVTDGFYWPLEFGPPSELPGTFSIYSTPGGRLVLNKDSYRLYGFEFEEDFSRACKTSLLEVKTPRGAITLGPLRQPPADYPMWLDLFPPGCGSRLTFIASGLHEADAISTILCKYMPEARIVKSTSRTASLFSSIPSVKRTFAAFKKLSASERLPYLFDTALFLLATSFVIAGWFDKPLSKLWFLSACIMAFTLINVSFFRKRR